MPYIGQSMSVNAYNAYRKGLLPRSRINTQMLKERGWTYSAAFFLWLCKNKYIMPAEFHHTTPMKRITPFYDLNNINFICQNYDLQSIHKVYLNKCSIQDILHNKEIGYVRIFVSRQLMHTNSDLYLDCIKFNRLFWWSKDKCFRVDSNQIVLIKEYDTDELINWNNPNREQLERLIFIRKNYYKKPQ
jgi:hypothetical protein